MITHVLLDIDGCITDGKNQAINLSAMLELQYKIKTTPVQTLLCTGRSAVYVEAMAQMLHIKDWCICENGAYLYHPISDEIWLNPRITEQQIQLIQEIKYKIKTDPFLKSRCKFEAGKEICLSLNAIGDLTITDLFDMIQHRFLSEEIEINRSTTAVDITPKHINKGSMFDIFCHKYCIDAQFVLGVGDSLGDLSFLVKCGRVACPSNAVQEIQTISSFIASQPSTLGLIEIYQHLTHPQCLHVG